VADEVALKIVLVDGGTQNLAGGGTSSSSSAPPHSTSSPSLLNWRTQPPPVQGAFNAAAGRIPMGATGVQGLGATLGNLAGGGGASAGAFNGSLAGGAVRAIPSGGAAGGVLAAVGAVGEYVAKTAENYAWAAQKARDFAVPLAQNDVGKNLKQMGEGVVDLARNIPVVGQHLGRAGDAALKVATAFGEAAQAFVDRGRELEQFSGPIAEARARADVRALQSDIAEADALGPSIAALTDSQSQFFAEMRDLLLPIKQFVAETLAGAMQQIVEFVRENKGLLAGTAAGIEQIIRAMVDIATLQWGKALGEIAAIPDRFVDAQRRARVVDEMKEDLLDRFLNLARAAVPGLPGLPEDAVNKAKDSNINAPVVKDLLDRMRLAAGV
jgi:hypothetical protein